MRCARAPEERRSGSARLGRRRVYGWSRAAAVGVLGGSRVFLLSPANCGGTRGKQVLSPNAQFDLARQLRSEQGAKLGDLFSFVSGLYFRGKLAYARRFAAPESPFDPGIYIITSMPVSAGPTRSSR